MTAWLEFTAAGGAAPMTAEFLAVDARGAARYLTGNPWPDQPPFDEIGAYAGPLGEGLGALHTRIRALAATRDALTGAPRALDSGALELTVHDEDGTWSLAWGPYDAPEPLRTVERTLRSAITGLRAAHREATLAVRPAPGGDALMFHNAGVQPFTGRIDAVWPGAEDADAVELLHGEPVPVGEAVDLEPGASRIIPLASRLGRALVGAHWTASWPGRAPVDAEAWLLTGL